MVLAQTSPSSTATLPFGVTGATETETRPWGSFTTLEEGPGYKIKRIEVNPGHRLSLQMHYHRSEHWIVLSGTAKVTCDEKIEVLEANQSTYVPQCSAHRLENPGVIKLVIIEVQNGDYLGEDDIVRFQDDYARG
ncbi:MAG: phosphomannose isomerase type II C-terminal cupin domain [Snowella sp.]|nr:phosphomannose isomerase type II C-terminal cupin domain [Snowella sp.]